MKLLACIVETRPVQKLVQSINVHMNMLPDKTDLCIIHSEQNTFIKSFFPEAKFLKVELNNINEYNSLLTSVEFWEQFLEYDKVLIFQTDSVLFRPGIEEFYDYDYVGAPWKFQEHGGNGGLSLRSPKVMHLICKNYNWEPHLGNEDVFFSNILDDQKGYGKLAPRDVCEKFSVETIFKLNTFGGHAYWKYLSETESNQITYQYK